MVGNRLGTPQATSTPQSFTAAADASSNKTKGSNFRAAIRILKNIKQEQRPG